jgi:hypothetical protein
LPAAVANGAALEGGAKTSLPFEKNSRRRQTNSLKMTHHSGLTLCWQTMAPRMPRSTETSCVTTTHRARA